MTTTYCQKPAVLSTRQLERYTPATTFRSSSCDWQPSGTPVPIGMRSAANRFLKVLLRSLATWQC